MADVVLTKNALSEHLMSRIQSPMVRVDESNGTITLIPLRKKMARKSRLIGMLKNTNISTEAYCSQKQRDKELE